MDKTKLIWYTLLVVLVIIVLNFAVNLFNKSEISKAKDDIKLAKEKIENAINKIDSAQSKINGLINNIDSTKIKLDEMNNSVNNLNFSMENKINGVSGRIKVLLDSVKADQKNMQSLRDELQNLNQ